VSIAWVTSGLALTLSVLMQFGGQMIGTYVLDGAHARGPSLPGRQGLRICRAANDAEGGRGFRREIVRSVRMGESHLARGTGARWPSRRSRHPLPEARGLTTVRLCGALHITRATLCERNVLIVGKSFAGAHRGRVPASRLGHRPASVTSAMKGTVAGPHGQRCSSSAVDRSESSSGMPT
jgi:hypothetical protein